ncbi:MAG: HlyC/CorC family transporter [Anaerolineae bacterium]|nr:HlyC/CorC family transporter [Anaerolineae bacterium]
METEASSIVNDLVGLVLIVVLVLLNAFFVAAEFALVSVRRTRVEELVAREVPRARAVHKAVADPDRFIAATQLGITLASLGLGWIGEPALAHLIDPIIELIPIPASWTDLTAHGISAAIGFGLITFIHVVVGELTPKSIALQRAEQTSLYVAPPMILVEWIFKPAIWLLNGTGNLILRLLGFQPAAGHELAHSVEEIKMLMDASADHGMMDDAEHDMLAAIFDLREMMVRQVMIPRTEMAALDISNTLRDMIMLQKKVSHGKFPVYENDVDHIVGVLFVRDIVEVLAEGNLDVPVRRFTRPAIFMPETARISAALTTFRDKRQHVAIALDEYGGTAGMITLEDILEEIAGELPDQFELDNGPEIAQRQDGSWDISGLALIEDVNEALDLALVDENYDTIGGYVMGQLERIPKKGDEVKASRAHFRVIKVDGMRVDRLRVVVNGEE